MIIFQIFILILIEIYCKHQKEQTYRKIFLNERTIKGENKTIDQLLSILVPDFVKESFIQGVNNMSEDQGEVAILFCDICNFDKIIKTENCGIIYIVDELYRKFDTFCLENHVQKIETVGKTYMACGGLKVFENTLEKIHEKNCTKRIIDLALNMINYSQKFVCPAANPIILKIGIHYGPVIAGVIGFHKPQFSLIGDTVNTASRVCSTGIDGSINISQEAYANIHGIFKNIEFIERIVPAKGKGELRTYQIRKKKLNDLSPQLAANSKNKNTQTNAQISLKEVDDKNIFLESKLRVLRNNNEIKLNLSCRTPKNVLFQQASNFINEGFSPKNNYRKNKINSLTFEENNSIFDREFSNLSRVSSEKCDQRKNFNLLRYLETDHFKQIIHQNKGKFINYIEKNELFPGQFSEKIIENTNQEKMQTKNKSEDDFFDKLKLSENTVDILKFNKSFLYLQNKNSKDLLDSLFNEMKILFFKGYFVIMIIFNFIYVGDTFLLLLKTKQDNWYLTLVIRVISSIFNIISLIILKKKKCEKEFLRKYFLFYIFMILTEIMSEFFLNFYLGMENILELLLFFLAQNNNIYINFIDKMCLASYMIFFLLCYSHFIFNADFFISIFLVCSCIIMILYNQRATLVNPYKNFNTIRINSMKKNQQNNLIVNLLPAHILEKFLMKPHEKLNLTEEFEDVTILFADIVGFTKYSSTVKPQEVVSMLQELFTEFDKACLDNFVYKLYTIGDCYVVLGLINAEERNIGAEAFNVIKMALQMIKIIEDFQKRVYQGLNMRIGIHTGKIIGGIIGTDIVRYDIYGKDVLIANKMESNGIEGCITVSEHTKELIESTFPNFFVFEEHQEIFLTAFNEIIKSFKMMDYKNI